MYGWIEQRTAGAQEDKQSDAERSGGCDRGEQADDNEYREWKKWDEMDYLSGTDVYFFTGPSFGWISEKAGHSLYGNERMAGRKEGSKVSYGFFNCYSYIWTSRFAF